VMSYLRSQGHEVKLFFDPMQYKRGYAHNGLLSKLFSVENYNIRKIKEFKPDACLFSCMTATYGWALHMAKRVKEEVGCKIIFGGVHPTLVPEEVKRHDFIDEVCEGDGIAYFGGEFDPDKIWADRESYLRELPSVHRKVQLFQTYLGCPFRCTYCGNEQLFKVGKYKPHRRSIEGCIKELKHLKEERGMRYVLFIDDVFTTDKKFIIDFLKRYVEEIKLPFACFGHPKYLDDNIVKLLKDAGCESIWIGIQTGAEDLRKTILNRPETNQEILDACALVKKHNIKLIIDHIFGFPYESNMSQDVSYNLYKECKPDVVNCYQLLYFPKAKIIESALKFGYLTPADVGKINRGEHIIHQMDNRPQTYRDTYMKALTVLPLGNIIWELFPMWLCKLIIHIRARRGFVPMVIIQNEVFFSWRLILKRLRII